ncbi:hypothetical protein PG994_004979 [Apiospora phragmitis]|uniref:Uncharacterized protein n=1 Tax=Apiospora phragmitis TaxID=2905665 RepID=A0ABR1VS43_9PEZI
MSPGASAPAADVGLVAEAAPLLPPPIVMFFMPPLMSMPGMLGSMSPSPSFMPPWAETAAAGGEYCSKDRVELHGDISVGALLVL